MAGLNFKTGENSTLRLQYRLFYMDYSNGSGSKEFGMEGLMQGPWIGYTFPF